MDQEIKQHLDAMMVQINHRFDRVLGDIASLRADLPNARSSLVDDVIPSARESLTIEQRLSQLERKSR